MDEIMTTFHAGPVTGETTLAPDPAMPTRFFLPAEGRREVTSPESAAEVLAPLVQGMDREVCAVAYLDTKHRSLGAEVVSIGSVNHTFMVPRDIFRGALFANASAVVVTHNHPSGDPEPSSDDATVTRRITQAGSLIGIEVLDHLVFGSTRWVSLARRGVL